MTHFLKYFVNLFLKIINSWRFSILVIWLFSFNFSIANATKQIQEVNYFSSFRASETNVRSGPGQNYPIKFTYKVKGIPVRVVSEYDNWNEVEDYEGQTGWVMQSLLTKKRMLMIYSKKPTVEMRKKNNLDAHLVYRLENFVIGEFIKCEEQWCAIKVNGKKGWVEKADVFGVESNRIILQNKPNINLTEDQKNDSIEKNSLNSKTVLTKQDSSQSPNIDNPENSSNNLPNKKEIRQEKNSTNNKSDSSKTSVINGNQNKSNKKN